MAFGDSGENRLARRELRVGRFEFRASAGTLGVAGNAAFHRPCHRQKVDGRSGRFLDRADHQIGRDPVGFVAEIVDPDELSTRDVALEADRVDRAYTTLSRSPEITTVGALISR
ncbi:hypothetical protein [Mesorhizobium sp.]|uniref:hypothetical protein n=1 Tax=Mesorhizobium sp. TaxID=1871066 RepID=UPI0025C5F9F2|nr:hypothetical protein [Mesorhizobium sp.]